MKQRQSELSRRGFLFGWLNKIKENIKETTELPGLLEKADKFIKEKHYDNAKLLLKKLLNSYSQSVEVKRRLGYLYYRLDDKERAKNIFEEIIQHQKDNRTLLYLAIINAKEQNEEKTISYLEDFFDPEDIILQREINLQLALYESNETNLSDLVQAIERVIKPPF